MKYKKHIATGALAISLLVGGTSVYANSPQDLGIKNAQQTFQRSHRGPQDLRIKNKRRGGIVGTISAITSTGFTLDVRNPRLQTTSSLEVKTDTNTVYKKNGLDATVADLTVGAKVIVAGELDKTTNTITANKVKIVTKVLGLHWDRKANS